jgi:hypothetical protein
VADVAPERHEQVTKVRRFQRLADGVVHFVERVRIHGEGEAGFDAMSGDLRGFGVAESANGGGGAGAVRMTGTGRGGAGREGGEIGALLAVFDVKKDDVGAGLFQAGEKGFGEGGAIGEEFDVEAAGFYQANDGGELRVEEGFAANNGEGLQAAQALELVKLGGDFGKGFDAGGAQVVAIATADVAAAQDVENGVRDGAQRPG